MPRSQRVPTATTAPPPPLPQHLERELQLPRIEGGRDGPERSRAAVAVGRAEVGVIEQVERFEAELEPRRPSERDLLGHCQIDLPEVRPAHAVARRVAERLAR